MCRAEIICLLTIGILAGKCVLFSDACLNGMVNFRRQPKMFLQHSEICNMRDIKCMCCSQEASYTIKLNLQTSILNIIGGKGKMEICVHVLLELWSSLFLYSSVKQSEQIVSNRGISVLATCKVSARNSST